MHPSYASTNRAKPEQMMAHFGHPHWVSPIGVLKCPQSRPGDTSLSMVWRGKSNVWVSRTLTCHTQKSALSASGAISPARS